MWVWAMLIGGVLGYVLGCVSSLGWYTWSLRILRENHDRDWRAMWKAAGLTEEQIEQARRTL